MKIDNNNDVILDSLAEGVITVDKEFRIKFFNSAAEKLTNFSRDQVIGSFCKEIFQSEFCFSNCPIANVLKNGKNIYDVETFMQCNNKKPIPVRLNAAIIREEDGEPSGGVISFRDITLLKNVENLLNRDTMFMGMIGKSKSMQEIFSLIQEVASSDVPVFIHGETGTGKELVANAIQSLSQRKDKQFIKVNCSVIPPNLLSSELFGHAKGAFTDAFKDRIGRFEFADKGTIFLDEVGELPIAMQPQLLRIIENGSFERLGETITRSVDVRIISATNINIEKAIEENKFRSDLYYRLNVVPIELPPLRNRREDIPLLVDYFIKKYSIVHKKNIEGIDDEALDSLISWDWTGNIRELENVIEFAIIKTKRSGNLCVCSLPIKISGNKKCKRKSEDVGTLVNENTANLIDILNRHRWNKSKAAEELGINRSTLWRKLKSLGLE